MTRLQMIRHAVSEARKAELGIQQRSPVKRVPIRHGTNAGYVAGCRLDCCKEAHAAYGKYWYQRKLERDKARLKERQEAARLNAR